MLLAVGLIAIIGCVYAYAIQDIDRTLKRADRYLTINNQPEDAEALARRVLFLDPSNAEAAVVLGTSLNQQQKFKEAIEAFRKVPNTSDLFPEASYGASACLMFDGQYSEAESLLKSLLESHPHFDSARELLRTLYVRTFRVGDALHLVTSRLRLQPDDLTYLPVVLKTAADFPLGLGIEHELAEYNQQFPNQPVVIAALARAYWLKGETAEAARHFHELMELPAPPFLSVVWATQFWIENGDLPKAQTALKLVESTLKTESVLPHQESAACAARAAMASSNRSYEKAQEHLNMAIRLDPSDPANYSKRATIRRRLGDKSGAAEDTVSAMRLGASIEELRRLASRVKNGEVSPQICQEVADQLAKQGNQELSSAWIRLKDALTNQRL